jgi:hypothetical protein
VADMITNQMPAVLHQSTQSRVVVLREVADAYRRHAGSLGQVRSIELRPGIAFTLTADRRVLRAYNAEWIVERLGTGRSPSSGDSFPGISAISTLP